MNCPDCGAYIGDEDLFCGECGRPRPPEEVKEEVRGEAKEQASKVLALPPLPAPAAPAPAPQATRTGQPSRRLVLIGLAGTVAVILCLGFTGIGIWLFLREETAPTQVALSSVPGMVTYQDDFEDPDSGWDVYNYGDTIALYSDGEYRLAVLREDYVAWGNPDPAQDLSDFEIEVDARAVEGPLDNNLGILVRYQDDNENFYWFQISSDGYFAVDRLAGDEWVTLMGWEESTAIRQGLGVTNRLKVTCSGDRFIFSVNDTYLGTVNDTNLSTGSIGLAAGTFGEAGVVIHFDNLKVYSLEE
jgi:hypothetical protein